LSSKFKERLMARTAGVAERAESANANRSPEAQSRSATMPAQLSAFRLEAREYQARIQELQALLEEARNTGGSMKVPLSDLYEVAGRRRHKSPEAFAELRENLRGNALVQPVAIRPRLAGGFELVSGHWRTDAYRELGRTEIECVLAQSTEDEASVGAFYANLLQSDLTDYEKYLGFRDIQARFPGITQAKMAERAGVPESSVSALMAFGDLPAGVLSLLNETPALLGATSGYALARLARAGKGERVVEAVLRLARKELDEGGAVKFAGSETNTGKVRAAPTVFKIKTGRAVYCSVRQTQNVVRIEFQDENQAKAVQDALKRILEEGAAKAAAQNDAQPEK
jgi:ParB family transcriptional regulator, chromosome partitioning protein